MKRFYTKFYFRILLFVFTCLSVASLGNALIQAQSTATLRVNAGGSNYTDSTSNVWSADTGFTGGQTYSVASSVAIANTSDPTLYRSERYGNATYALTVPNGNYTLKLHFAEIYFTQANQRKFNVSAEGTQILSSYDIVADAGAANKAVIKSFPLTISDGQLNLAFTGVVDNAKISAIEVVPASSTLTKVSGDGQTGIVGSALANPLVVQVSTTSGAAQPGVAVTFAIVAGNGSLSTTTATTSTNGQASTVLSLGTTVGSNTVSATVSGIGTVSFTATGSAGPASQLAISPLSSSTSVNTAVGYQATLKDQYGNTATTATGNVAFSSSGVNGSFSPTTVATVNGLATSSFTATTSGTATISASGNGLTTSPTATLSVLAQNMISVRVNAGGNSYTDSASNIWSADTGFTGGGTYQVTSPISGTTDPTLYQSERYGNATYALNVPNGNYTLKLHFAEIYFTQANQRKFNVSAEGTQILSSYDIVADAGAANKAVIKSFPLTISDGQLNLAFTGVVDNAKISAIEVVPASSTATIKITKVSGDNQVAVAGTNMGATNSEGGSVGAPLVVQVTDNNGVIQQGITVSFATTAGNGSISPTSGLTDSQGKASTNLTLGTIAGNNTITATISGGASVTFTATGTAGQPSKLALSPTTANTSSGVQVAYQAVVQDQYGNTVTSATNNVNFSASGTTGTFTSPSVSATAGIASNAFTPTSVGTATITAAANGVTAATATLNVTLPSQSVLRVITGGSSYTDSSGSAWSADTGFTGGDAYSTNATITGTTDQGLYQSERYGNFSYNLTVPNGNYTLKLYFSENYWTTAGQRKFNVTAQSQQVLTNYDIWADAGASRKAVIKSFPVTVTNGQLPLSFVTVLDNAKVDAIELVATGTSSVLSKVSGDNQSASAGSSLSNPLVVQVIDQNGMPKPGITVNFVITAGNGSVSNVSVVSDSQGRASSTLTLGKIAGTNTVSASAANAIGVLFNATGNAGAANRLNITLPASAALTNQAVTYQVTVIDQYGNTVTSATSSINFAVSGVTGSFTPSNVNAVSGSGSTSFLPTSAGKATITASANGLASTTAKLIVGAPNAIILENQQTGTTAWQLTNQATSAEILGYADATSVNKGGTINLKVSVADASPYRIDIYRLGHYGGTGGRLMQSSNTLSGIQQPACPTTDVTTLLLECSWSTTYSLSVGNNWTSGLYVANLTVGSTGKQSQIWFVVRDDSSTSTILAQSSVATFLAYNPYGGHSLYGYNSVNSQPAVKVSLDRPFAQTSTDPGNYNNMLNYEHFMVRWMESQGYDVSYITNVDFETNSSVLNNHKIFLDFGHDEYWSLNERNGVESARDSGKHLAFFSANSAYWRVRYESSSSGIPNRVMVGYKEAYAQDPQLSTAPTARWRDPVNNRPENALLGVMYIGDKSDRFGGFDFIVKNSSDAYYANTTLKDGDTLSLLVGFEWDSVVDNGFSPANLTVLSESLVFPTEIAAGMPSTTSQISNAVKYTAASGAKVFATGSIQWLWGLDSTGISPFRADPRAQQFAANVLGDMGAVPYTPSANLILPSNLFLP